MLVKIIANKGKDRHLALTVVGDRWPWDASPLDVVEVVLAQVVLF